MNEMISLVEANTPPTFRWALKAHVSELAHDQQEAMLTARLVDASTSDRAVVSTREKRAMNPLFVHGVPETRHVWEEVLYQLGLPLDHALSLPAFWKKRRPTSLRRSTTMSPG